VHGVSNPQKRRGDRAEREVAAILSDELGVTCRRELGAGRRDDCGDIRLDNTCIQVKNYRSLDEATSKAHMDALERQQANADAEFAAMFCRRVGGRYLVVMTPAMFATLWREATNGRVYDVAAWDERQRVDA
jgi:hypothetical protein